MELIADGLLIATAMTAGLYCLVLSRRLGRLSDSGNGIGSQIDALDQALSETRAALTETQGGMSELRNSAKAAASELARETKQGEAMALRIERGIGDAKATMQRLYEATDRIEAHENGPVAVEPAGEDDPEGAAGESAGDPAPAFDVQPGAIISSSIGWEGEDEPADLESAQDDDAGGPKVILPEGKVETPEPSSAAMPGATKERAGSVLKAERVIL